MRLLGAPGVDRGDRPAGEEAGAEPDGLVAGSLGEPHAGDAAREAEVVADHRAGAGLAADSLGLQHDRGQSLGGAVDGGREPGRAGTDDRQVDDRVDLDVVGPPVDLDRDVVHALDRLRRAADALHERQCGARAGLLDRAPGRPRCRRGRSGPACPSGRGSRGSRRSARCRRRRPSGPSPPPAARRWSPSRRAARTPRCGTPRRGRRAASGGRRRTCPWPGLHGAGRRPR